MRAYVVAHLKNGSIEYLHRNRYIAKFTTYRRWAWEMTPSAAEEKVLDLHRVQANGKCWQEVQFFDVVHHRD